MVTEPGRALRPPTANPRPGGVPGGGRFPGRIRPGNRAATRHGFRLKGSCCPSPVSSGARGGGTRRAGKRGPAARPGRSAARFSSRGRPIKGLAMTKEQCCTASKISHLLSVLLRQDSRPAVPPVCAACRAAVRNVPPAVPPFWAGHRARKA